jgi:hypothetical protein
MRTSSAVSWTSYQSRFVRDRQRLTAVFRPVQGRDMPGKSPVASRKDQTAALGPWRRLIEPKPMPPNSLKRTRLRSWHGERFGRSGFLWLVSFACGRGRKRPRSVSVADAVAWGVSLKSFNLLDIWHGGNLVILASMRYTLTSLIPNRGEEGHA